MPIQGKFEKGIRGKIRLFPKYQAGLKDIEGFSHLVLIYHLNRSKEERLVSKPFLEDKEHGLFAIRSPHRPNHIGFSIVKLEKVGKNIIVFSEVDMLDGTPL
jgi:tRNA (adenine37-N6)-methyltransferase